MISNESYRTQEILTLNYSSYLLYFYLHTMSLFPYILMTLHLLLVADIYLHCVQCDVLDIHYVSYKYLGLPIYVVVVVVDAEPVAIVSDLNPP